MRACIPYGWQEKDEPIILKDVDGKRINVIGIMNVRNELYYEKYEKSVNSKMVIICIDRFSENLEKKTVLLMDQASIHTSDNMMEKIEEWEKKNLEIFWLPTYSPKLNLIEILWRFIKYEWVEVSAYDNHRSLRSYFKKVLDNFGTEYVINFA
jgi:transposase